MWSPVEVVHKGDSSNTEAPCARGKHAAALLGGHVYVLGGRGAGGSVPLRDCWRYRIDCRRCADNVFPYSPSRVSMALPLSHYSIQIDKDSAIPVAILTRLATGRWERIRTRGELPPALQEHTATPHENKLYIFGGEASLSAETPLWILDCESLIWRKLPGAGGSVARRRGRNVRPSAPTGRRGHSAHALNDCLLIYGGYKDLRGSTNELWAFHYETETWQQVRTAVAGPARHRHAAALHDNRLYIHGGQCDLRACADLWFYDTLSRLWTPVRTPAKLSPSARSGHAGLRAGAHFYIFGGEVDGHPTSELWRFHFATETWERIVQSMQWPAPRIDACALLLAGMAARVRSAPPERGTGVDTTRPDPPGLLREISKLSAFHIRRAARCSYSVLAGERDSTESLVRDTTLAKSRSAYVIDERQPADGNESPRHGDVPESLDLSREPISVPDFADMVLPTPVLSPIETTRLVYFDSEEEEDMRRETEAKRRNGDRTTAIPKSASVRFTRDSITVTTEEEGELSTSDYASAERVNRLSGFSNPHYLGPDVRALGARATRAALTPDSGCNGDIELQDMRRKPEQPRTLSILVLGGRETSHPAHMSSPLSMWTYRLL